MFFWVNAYSGSDLAVGSAGFAEAQVYVSVYCGQDTCADPETPGGALPKGLIYKALLPPSYTGSFWWKSGTLSAGGDHGNMALWLPCLSPSTPTSTPADTADTCAVFEAEKSPQNPKDATFGVGDGGAWLGSEIGGLYEDDLPHISKVTLDVYHVGIGKMIKVGVKLQNFADSMLVLPRGDYKGTYKAAGFVNDVFYFTVWETKFTNGDTTPYLTLQKPFFIRSLQRGEVRMIMTWLYDCAEDGAATCETPLQPLMDYDGMTSSDTAAGADEVDTLIMPTVDTWSGEGYAYWDSSRIVSLGAAVEFDADFATGGYPETTLFSNLDKAQSPVADFQCWVHAYSGLDGCNQDCEDCQDPLCEHSFAYNQVKVRIVCGADTCVDELGHVIAAGTVYTSMVPQGNADIENGQFLTGIYWWRPGKLSSLPSGKVEWHACTSDCVEYFDDNSPYLFGGGQGRILNF